MTGVFHTIGEKVGHFFDSKNEDEQKERDEKTKTEYLVLNPDSSNVFSQDDFKTIGEIKKEKGLKKSAKKDDLPSAVLSDVDPKAEDVMSEDPEEAISEDTEEAPEAIKKKEVLEEPGKEPAPDEKEEK